MPDTTRDDLERLAADLGRRHGFDEGAALALLRAIEAGGGGMAQFDHPGLGGMGQWSRGGMTMIGSMSDHGLKARVQALAEDLADHARGGGRASSDAAATGSRQSQSQGAPGSSPAGGPSVVAGGMGQRQDRWWPDDLGEPASTGAQNELRYAVFPDARRLAIRDGGRTTVYDTGEHRIGGFSQQQGGVSSATFTSQHGTVRVAELRVVDGGGTSGGSGTGPRFP